MLNYIQYPEDILRLEVLEVLVHAILVLDGDDPQTFYPWERAPQCPFDKRLGVP
jgi:hypothetical protein